MRPWVLLLVLATAASCRDSIAEPPRVVPDRAPPPKPAPPPPPAPTPPPPAPVDLSTVIEHPLPDGPTETCQLLVDFPFTPPDVPLDAHGFAQVDTWYGMADYAAIADLCNLEIDGPIGDPPIAICPKLKGTQPAVELFDLSDTRYAKNPQLFEQRECGQLHRHAPKIAKLKTQVFGREPEAGFLYFHFSRLLGNLAHVPPVTYRSILASRLIGQTRDGVHILVGLPERRLKGALEGGFGRMTWMLQTNPDHADARRKKAYAAITVPDDPDLAWGALAENPRGEMNHSTFSSFGTGAITTAAAFRRTWYYKALSSKKPLGSDFTPQQMADLHDFEDLLLLDGLFNQADRNGNIHADLYKHKLDDDGRLHQSKHGKGIELRRLLLRDNDDSLGWGSKPKFEFAKLVRELRHLDPLVYDRIQWLAELMRDPDSDQQIADWFAASAHVSHHVYERVRDRFVDLADYFAARYVSGDLLLDIDLEAALASAE